MDSVKYIGPESVSSSELSPYLIDPELIPNKVEIGSHDVILKSIEKLFDFAEENTFANFSPPPMYSLKNLFREKVIPHLDIKQAIATFDEMKEGEEGFSEEERSKHLFKLYEMFYQILELNDLVEEIRLRLISLLKT